MRREPKAILVAHKMDPTRRDVYVEGPDDKSLVKWVSEQSIGINARILTIDGVDLPEVQGGNRGRLIEFARLVEDHPAKIRFLADADTDRLLGRPIPSNVWLTDFRDAEGYFFQPPCVEKALALGIGDRFDAEQVLGNILSRGRILGALRLFSERENMQLPFQRTDPWKSLSYSSQTAQVDLDLRRYVGTLLQNAGRSLTEREGIIEGVNELIRSMRHVPDHELLHGKDAVLILEKVLIEFDIPRGNAVRILRASFERSHVENYPNLNAVVRYLSE